MAYGFTYGFSYGISAAEAAPPAPPKTYAIAAVPNEGWIGDLVSIPATGLYTRDRDIAFNDPALLSKWTLAGVGQYTNVLNNNELRLRVGGASDSSVSLQDNLPYYSADISVTFIVDNVTSTNPTSAIDYIGLKLTGDANNYAIVSRSWSADFGHVFKGALVLDGVVLPTGNFSTKSNIGELRIINAIGSITLLARTSTDWVVLGFTRKWKNPFVAYTSVYTANYLTNERVSVRPVSFKSIPNVMYGLEPSTDTIPTLYEVASTVPDPRWARYEVRDTPITLFDHTGTRGFNINGFRYTRRGHARIKRDSHNIIDIVGNKPLQRPSIIINENNVPFILPGRLPFTL